MPDIKFTKELVKSKILGFRKGTNDEPNYEHSLRVYENLKKYGFSDDVQIAGLLHDIVEDGGVSLEDLKDMGYSDYVVELVSSCSHDTTMTNSFHRREQLVRRIIEKDNIDVWAIKLADISDNTSEIHLLPSRYNKLGFLFKKCSVFIKYGHIYFAGTEFYQEFLDRYFKQVKRLGKFLD